MTFWRGSGGATAVLGVVLFLILCFTSKMKFCFNNCSKSTDSLTPRWPPSAGSSLGQAL